MMPAKGAAGNHDGLAGYDKPGLGHAREEEQEPRLLARLCVPSIAALRVAGTVNPDDVRQPGSAVGKPTRVWVDRG